MHKTRYFCSLGEAVIEKELAAIVALRSRLDDHFEQACDHLLQCQGRIVVVGMGKSGHIGRKIAATFASTGSPAFFVHPGEASHGDLGMITSQDAVLIVSYSGETDEIIAILPLIKRLNISLITLTGKPKSTLAKVATVNLNIQVAEEACPLNLAPTASTTAALVMGDALAIALLDARGFTAQDFARAHPGGHLGRQLLLRVYELMHTGEAIPIVQEHAVLSQALVEVTRKKLGMTCIANDSKKLLGIFTDGDLRRAIDQNVNIHTTPINTVMTSQCQTISKNLLAVEALRIMEDKKITSLIITNGDRQIDGVIHMHDLLQAKVM